MRFAKVVNGIVDVISHEPQTGEDWVKVSDDVFAGFLRDGDDFVAPPQPSPPVPMSVSRFQARAALHIAGLLPQIEAAVANADPLVQIAWADAQEFRRNSPTIVALATALGLPDETLDQLFRDAAQIAA